MHHRGELHHPSGSCPLGAGVGRGHAARNRLQNVHALQRLRIYERSQTEFEVHAEIQIYSGQIVTIAVNWIRGTIHV